ncbi:MAG: cation transporter, partial [Lachnospiraceae bacterium]|nr:cation transporter [Lachnospiraceae bacterium]
SFEWAIQMHGFYVDLEKKTMRFDVVLSFDVDRIEAIQTLIKELKSAYPDYNIEIVPDADLAG